jgi:hypothetical protein
MLSSPSIPVENMISTAFDPIVAWVTLLTRRLVVVPLETSDVLIIFAVPDAGCVALIGYKSPSFNPEPNYTLALPSLVPTVY